MSRFTNLELAGGGPLADVGVHVGANAHYTAMSSSHKFEERARENADYTVVAEPGRAHQAVVEDFIAAVRGGEGDACYRSAREQREVRL